MKKRKEPQFEAFDSFEEFFDQAEKRSDYWEELAKLEFTREILVKMEKAGVSRTELANRLEVRPGMVTRLLSGRNNFEISTMVRMAMAVKCRFRSFLEYWGTSNIVVDVTNLSNCFLPGCWVNAETFKPTSQVIFTTMINTVSDGDAGRLSENSQAWRKSHPNFPEMLGS